MSWELSSTGFAMTLTNYVPSLIEEDFEKLVNQALYRQGFTRDQITQWAIHPGGRRILESIEKSLSLPKEKLETSYQMLKEYGNMSSPTILFVLKQILADLKKTPNQKVFGEAFGPGLTMETFIVGSSS